MVSTCSSLILLSTDLKIKCNQNFSNWNRCETS